MRISDWSSDVCSSDLRTDWSLRSASIGSEVTHPSRQTLHLASDSGCGTSRTIHRGYCGSPQLAGVVGLDRPASLRHRPAGADGLTAGQSARRRPGSDRSEEHTSDITSLMRHSYSVLSFK